MRIAQIAPLRVAVPPHDYGGTERIISNLTEMLARLDLDVTLFASGDSQTRARLIAPVERALTFDQGVDATAYHVAMLAEIYRHASQFDIIHAHLDYLVLPFAAMSRTPTVTTLHGRLDKPEFAHVFRAYRDANYVAISKSQQSYLPDVNWAGVVHHGVDVPSFPFHPEPGGYLAFVGRISPEKRPDRAIEVAIKTGIPLKIAAKVDPVDRDYFEQTIEPMLDHPLIEFLGPVDEARKREIMANALALIVPIDWAEPFGIVFIEALACGTPVLTCPCGSVPELLEDGVTGYIRSTVDELAEAALRVRADISRRRCRDYASQHFDLPRMANEYLKIYDKVIRRNGVFALPHDAGEIPSAPDALAEPAVLAPFGADRANDAASVAPLAAPAEKANGRIT
jgi:glycosyltransferase involved in cell wall biosynthesis